MEDILIQVNLRWLGHVERMLHDRLPLQMLYSFGEGCPEDIAAFTAFPRPNLTGNEVDY